MEAGSSAESCDGADEVLEEKFWDFALELSKPSFEALDAGFRPLRMLKSDSSSSKDVPASFGSNSVGLDSRELAASDGSLQFGFLAFFGLGFCL
mmetsp:Transcript_19493/g.54239  ORF Transcript_19493/g.54239 Transcript_19493/m.54239 type:complete len:94 (-) Transcript_19493:662-943(-)